MLPNIFIINFMARIPRLCWMYFVGNSFWSYQIDAVKLMNMQKLCVMDMLGKVVLVIWFLAVHV